MEDPGSNVQPNATAKISGSLISVLIGDAMGMPVEMMTRKEIFIATGGKGVTGFLDPIQQRIKDTMYYVIGQFTDDYQLTRAVAISLIRCGRFDLIDCLNAHLDELAISDSGFGKSTRDNLRVLRDIFAAARAAGVAEPVLPGPSRLLGMGSGNGIGMKVAPLAFFHSNNRELRNKHIFELGFATHKDPQASMAGALVASVIARVFNDSIGFCSAEVLKKQISIIASRLIVELIEMENEYATGPTALRENMINLARLVSSGEISDPSVVAKTLGTGCYCVQSIPFSIGMFLRNPRDVRAAIIDTINQGGDTDSNASMVGAMVGANLGIEAVPVEWKNFRNDYREAVRLALELSRVIGMRSC